MKIAIQYISLFIFLGFSVITSAQTNDCNCSKELSFLHKKLKKTPAYKQNATNYKFMYPQIVQAAQKASTDFDCLLLLNKLALTLNDNHIRIKGPKSTIDYKKLKDSNYVASIQNSSSYLAYHTSKLNIDSLENVLKNKPFDGIEGIYYRENYATIGCYFDASKKMYYSVILSSDSHLWTRGEVMYAMIPYGNNYLRVVGGNLIDKRIITYGERIHQGLFLVMRFQKDLSKGNHTIALHPKETYKRVELNETTTYLKIGSFKSNYPILSDADKFYKTLENTLTKPHLIIDLRDNTGGGNRNSNGLLKIVKKYLKNHNIYIIVNQRTGSNAEQFAYKLSSYKNCTILGDQTLGSVAYEIKNSTYYTPCNNYKATLTSKKHNMFLDIESKGIQPKVMLTYNTPWLDQVLAYINNQ